MFNNKEIGNKIKNLRKINGYTQEEIAEKLDIGDRIKISRIENGKQSMTANEMIKFCKLLNISLDSLINNENLSSEDFIDISKRYIFNEKVDIEERKEVVKKLYIELANKELSNIDMYNQMNKNNSKVKESSNNAIEKYKIDDII
ncbi:MAG TPA: helix-turn-helix transcriptional regulator [Candidatus Scatovivens faecipullorum]|nr:helix-turn-helix transcriptional regulator [Candidatus Scatovivens faecipullorum]